MTRAALAFLTILLLAGNADAADQNVVRIYNWSDYIAPGVLDEFTRETGIQVIYDTFDSDEALEAKLLAGHTGYDVVVPSAAFLQPEIRAGVFLKLDRTKLPNWKNLWPAVMRRLAVYDPGNQYAVNYMWFTTGIAYNAAEAKKRFRGHAPDSWDILFKPQEIRKFADCGVYMLDRPEAVLTSALRYLRLNPDSKNPVDIQRAADVVLRVKRYVKKFRSSKYINALANGDICLALGRGGESLQARDRAAAASNGVDVDYVIPKEGGLMSLDNLAIPKDAPDPESALKFINFLMRPDIAARNTNATGFANGVLASKPFVEKNIRDNPAVYPPTSIMQRLYTVTMNAPPLQKMIEREWLRVKRGR